MAFVTGCAAAPRRTSPTPSAGSAIVVSGDWDDIVAALTVAADRSELAVVREVAFQLTPFEVFGVSTRRRSFDLVTPGAEPVRVNFRAHSSDDPGDISVFVRIGRFGDAEGEVRVLNDIAKRLRELAGRDYAPLGR